MRLYLIAGEASGDLHTANLVRALSTQKPMTTFRGMGGDNMQQAGVQLVEHIKNTNFMGFVEVVKNLPMILSLFTKIKTDILSFKPDAVILVDYPGFNLRMAKWLHQHKIRVFYYISPQLWAWKKGRVKIIQQFVEHLYVILPFEQAFYKQFNVNTTFVGHPLLDVIPQDFPDQDSIKKALNIPLNKKILALLPGSRKQEIQAMLPTMLKAAKQRPEYLVIVAAAPNQPVMWYQKMINQYNHRALVLADQTYKILSIADYAFVTSGTATLETALFQVPEIVCYKGMWLSYQIAKILVKVPFISLVNLILEKEVVKELIQQDFSEDGLLRELSILESDDKRESMLAQYLQLRKVLGTQGVSNALAADMLSRLSRS
ncbi:MAG: lipid-A-disaccharide synthase [Bacteroidia bacterium]|nr:lipid-A-disaccharide synthase [Bacteroidia bacterium]